MLTLSIAVEFRPLHLYSSVEILRAHARLPYTTLYTAQHEVHKLIVCFKRNGRAWIEFCPRDVCQSWDRRNLDRLVKTAILLLIRHAIDTPCLLFYSCCVNCFCRRVLYVMNLAVAIRGGRFFLPRTQLLQLPLSLHAVLPTRSDVPKSATCIYKIMQSNTSTTP